MDNISSMKTKWSEYRYRVERFEIEKEREIRDKHPFLSQEEVDRRLDTSVKRRFKGEARTLLDDHLKG